MPNSTDSSRIRYRLGWAVLAFGWLVTMAIALGCAIALGTHYKVATFQQLVITDEFDNPICHISGERQAGVQIRFLGNNNTTNTDVRVKVDADKLLVFMITESSGKQHEIALPIDELRHTPRGED